MTPLFLYLLKNSLRVFSALLLVFWFTGCSDLLLEPKSKPNDIDINPSDLSIIAGYNFGIEIIVEDENGNSISSPPAWTDTVFTTSGSNILQFQGDSIMVSSGGRATLGVQVASFFDAVEVQAFPRLYMTQSIQRYDRSVPMVAGKDAVLRVFIYDDLQVLTSEDIQLKLFQNGSPAKNLAFSSGSIVPTTLGNNISSLDLFIPGSNIQPGLSVLVETSGGTTFPETGEPLAVNVQDVPVLNIELIPIFLNANGFTGNVTANNMDEFLEATLDMYPVSTYNDSLHAVYTTNLSPLAEGFWSNLLSQIAALRTVEGDTDYYYGVVPKQGDQGIIGIGYVGGQTALGWDSFPDASTTMAHELGHNFNRLHAPCGGPDQSDLSYPYPDASIGLTGYEVDENDLKSPNVYKDLMSYCAPEWVSDYTYTGILNYRKNFNLNKKPGRPQDVLLVWGRISNGKLELEPAFQISAPPKLPAKPGPYTLSGLDVNGNQLFSISFSGQRVSHGAGNRNFAFAIPVNQVQIKQLSVLQLTGKGKRAMQQAPGSAKSPSGTAALPAFTVRRRNAKTVSLQWKSGRYQMALVKDPHTGEVLSFTREGISDINTDAAEVQVYFSDGIHTSAARLSVQ